MPRLGKTSKRHLGTCHEDLKRIAHEAIKYVDFSVVEGHRGKEKQNQYFRQGLSKLEYPDSRHNSWPSEAIHIIPYPEHWAASEKRWYYLGGVIMTVADMLYDKGEISHRLRWGGDWDGDDIFSDQGFDDLAHYELRS